MKTMTLKHPLTNIQPLSTGSLAYWSKNCVAMFGGSNSDRTPEIDPRVLRGQGS
jgi:hypothetical protein